MSSEHVFISYSHTDKNFVKQLHAQLRRRVPSLWLDLYKLRAGQFLKSEIDRAIDQAAYVVIVLSPDSVASEWVQYEIDRALNRAVHYDRPYLIALIAKWCTIPTGLAGQIYIDFTNPNEFQTSVEKLLVSVTVSEPTGLDRFKNPQAHSEELVASKLRQEHPDDEYFNTLADMPLTKRFGNSVKYQLFSGDFETEILDFLSFYSNVEGGLHLNNLIVLLGFFRDASHLRDIDIDYVKLIRNSTEEPAISSGYKWWLISELRTIFDRSDDPEVTKLCSPRIVPRYGFSEFLDRSIEDAFAEKRERTSALGNLWRIYRHDERLKLLDYIERVSIWNTDTVDIYSARNAADFDSVVEHFQAAWMGVSHVDRGGQTALEVLERVEERSVEHMGRLIEMIEIVSAAIAEKKERSLAIRLFEAIDHYADDLNKQHWKLQLLLNVICSPCTDRLSATIGLFSLVTEFGIESLKFDGRFPRCLVARKAEGLFPAASLIDSLVGCAEQGDVSAALLLVGIMDLYQHRAFIWVSVHYAIGEIVGGGKAPSLIRILRRASEKKLSLDKAKQLILARSE